VRNNEIIKLMYQHALIRSSPITYTSDRSEIQDHEREHPMRNLMSSKLSSAGWASGARKCIAVCSILIAASTSAFAQQVAQTKLAVINQAGEVWARDINATMVGAGEMLQGPSLFGGPDDGLVLGSTNNLYVVTKSGAVWAHDMTPRTVSDTHRIDAGSPLPGTLFGGPDAKYVLYDETAMMFYVVTTNGIVWAHPLGQISGGYPLKGPSLFGAQNDKYVLLDGNRILVVNTRGQIWAHDLSCTNPIPQSFLCPPDTVGAGYMLNGPSLIGAPNDKYVVLANGRLMVINTFGEVWARNISASTVDAGYKLSGPTLFGGANDKYVVVYDLYFD
jgi:hypothetical protein